ncbi:CDP-alcohol phosphatidyltransferase family protein [Agromyces sp. MMS24-JH15]|uniref:CDP-alcohol phosphatidyltransferase family protein n=1 Tax=Agromyces sp. MMS24-JH15 TaxID=3243765 RepID=UPI003749D42B
MARGEVQLAPIALAGLGAAGAAAIWAAGGLAPIGWTAAVGYLAASTALLVVGLRRDGSSRLGWANAVTATRSALVALIAGLVVASFVAPIPTPLLIGVTVPALALDAVDGWVARRTGTATEFGARFDMEVDAFLLLVLSAYVAQGLGTWVLAIGLMRYAFAAAGWVHPWLRAKLPYRYWRKVVAALQGIALAAAASGLLAPAAAAAVVAIALALLVESFGRDVAWLAQRDRARRTPRERSRSGRAPGAGDDRGRDREHHDADHLDDDGLGHEREVPRLGDAEESDGQGEQERREARDEEQQAQHRREDEEPPVQDEHRDRQRDARDAVQHEEHPEDASDAVEHEVDVDPADGEEDDRTEDPDDHQGAAVGSGHVHTRFRSKPPIETS